MTDFVTTLLNMSITAAIIALVVMLLRLIFKKRAPKRAIVFLWVLVAIRLVCPIQIETDLSLMPKEPVKMVQNISHDYSTQTLLPAENRDTDADYEDAEQEDETAESVEYPVVQNTDNTEKIGAVSVKRKLSAGEIAALVWAVGAAAMLIYMIISYVLLHRQVRVSMRRSGNVYIADDIGTSFILGLFRPRIYVPSYLTEKETDYVLSHEKQHIRHLDHLWKPFGFILLSINWFNPILWFSYVLFCKDIELACDESVISKLDTDGRKEYSTVLLKCSMERHFITACPIAFGETGVKERVKAMKDYKKPTIIIIIAVVLVGIITAVLLLTSPKAKKTDNDKSNDATGSQSAKFEQNDDLFNAPLPLKDGEELMTEWSYAKAMTDIDNDGKADRVTYACIGEDNNTVIVVEFGDRQKEAVRTYLEGDIIHPQMVLSKTGEDNLIYIHEKSQGSSGEELLYVFSCDKDGKIRMYDGKSEINNIYDVCINKLPLFDLSIGNVKMLADDNAKIKLKYAGSELNLTIPKKTFEQNDYIGEYYVRLIQSDTLEINPQTNTVTYKLYAAVCYKPDKYYEELCSPAIATMVLEYRNGMFDISSLSFEENPEFKELFGDSAATPEQSPTPTQEPTPSPSQNPTPTPKPSSTENMSVKFTDAAKKDIDLDGDGRKEQIIIGNDSRGSDPELRLTIKSNDGNVIYKSYTDEGDWYYYYAYRIWIADISGDGRLAVFVDYKTESGALSTIGFFVKAGKTEKIKSQNLTDMDGNSYMGNGIQSIKNGKIVVMKLDELLGTWGWTMKGRFDTDKNRIVYQKKATRTYADDSYSPVLTQSTYAYDESGKRVDLPTGRAYQPIETDFATYAWIQDETGAKYKIEIARKGGWTYTINGIEQDELFEEGLPYAG